MRNEVNDFYVNYLKCLSQKIAFCASHDNAKANQDVEKKLKTLRHYVLICFPLLVKEYFFI